MYIVAIGWLWVVLMMALTEASLTAGILTFLFYGAGLVVFPVVLAYTIGVYAIFRGKLHDGYD